MDNLQNSKQWFVSIAPIGISGKCDKMNVRSREIRLDRHSLAEWRQWAVTCRKAALCMRMSYAAGRGMKRGGFAPLSEMVL